MSCYKCIAASLVAWSCIVDPFESYSCFIMAITAELANNLSFRCKAY